METKELSGCRHGTSKQHAPPRKSNKNPKTQKKKSKIILEPLASHGMLLVSWNMAGKYQQHGGFGKILYHGRISL